MKCIEDAADIGVVTAGGKIVVEFLDKTIYNERSQRCRMAPPVFEEREDRLLKKGKIKIIALIGAFVLTVLIVGLINRHSSNDTTDNMAGATLPVVTLTYADEEINELHGHTAQMNAVYMRDSITPLDKAVNCLSVLRLSAIPLIRFPMRSEAWTGSVWSQKPM